MNNRKNTRSFLPAVILLFIINNSISSQASLAPGVKPEADSLSLKNIIEQVIKNYPTVKIAEEAINNADSRISLAKAGYYPEADVTANYSRIGPVTKLTIPDIGNIQLFPDNNYSASLNYRQLVYDFGRTRQNIDLENGNKGISEQTTEQVKQKLSLFAVNNFYTLAYLQAALKIKDEQLLTLKQHLDHTEKMRATGSATEYQVLATQVKISTVESQKVDLTAALLTQMASLNSLLGNDQKVEPVVKTELSVELPSVQTDSVLKYAFHNRDEVILNEKKTSLAEMRYESIKLQNKPVINFLASGGAKNGYYPTLNKLTPNYVVGLGIRIPLLDGMKTRYNLAQAQSAIVSLSYESEFTKRNVSNELSEAEAYMIAAQKKVSQFKLQLEQAEKAYALAETSFSAGVITNLDLLDANTTVSESRLMLLKSRIDYAASIYKLKAAMGERLY
jgi:outer membrane protein TolC